jgi:hypothetical protein
LTHRLRRRRRRRRAPPRLRGLADERRHPRMQRHRPSRHPGRAGHAAGATPRECSDRRRHALVHRHRCDQRRPALITPAPLSTATVTTNASALVHSSPDYAERDVLRIFHGATTKGGPWSGTDDWVSGKSWPVEWAHNSSTPRFSGVYTVRTTHTTNGSLPGLRISVSHRAANGSMLGRSQEQTIISCLGFNPHIN